MWLIDQLVPESGWDIAHDTAASQVEFEGRLGFCEMLIGPMMFAITGDKKPVFTGVVKPAGTAWNRTKLTLAVGVHLCF